MILDEPNEDAENLDDETVLESYIDDAPSTRAGGARIASDLPD